MSKNKRGMIALISAKDLAQRWNVRIQTLQKWRIANEGPRYIKIGGRVMYNMKEIAQYEKERTFCGTSRRADSNE